MRTPQNPDDVSVTSNTLSDKDLDNIGERVSHALRSMEALSVTPKESELDKTALYDLTATIASYEHPRKQIGIAVNGDSVEDSRVIPVAAATHAKTHGHAYTQPQLAELQNWNNENTYQSRKNKAAIGKTILDAASSYKTRLVSDLVRLEDFKEDGRTTQYGR